MSRVIFSMYINIPSKDIEEQHSNCAHTRKNTYDSTNKLLENYDWLKSKQKKYAEQCQADYVIFRHDEMFEKFRKLYFADRPYVSTYDIINFYKIWLMYQLDYDEILYLDLDVVPFTNENIFEQFNFDEGILCRVNHEGNITINTPVGKTVVRSPKAKWWNARALLLDEGLDGENDVYNTGIVGASRRQLELLNYFENFDSTLNMMHDMTSEDCGYPERIRILFGYDNETLFSYKMKTNNVNLIELDKDWHFIMVSKTPYITTTAKMVHVISKDFEFARKRYEKNHL